MDTREVKKHIDGLNNLLRYSVYEPTEVIAIMNHNEDAINIVACGSKNDGHAFYHIEPIADYCRAFRLDCYAYIESGEIKIRIF